MIVRLFSVLSCESKERKEKKKTTGFFFRRSYLPRAPISVLCVYLIDVDAPILIWRWRYLFVLNWSVLTAYPLSLCRFWWIVKVLKRWGTEERERLSTCTGHAGMCSCEDNYRSIHNSEQELRNKSGADRISSRTDQNEGRKLNQWRKRWWRRRIIRRRRELCIINIPAQTEGGNHQLYVLVFL